MTPAPPNCPAVGPNGQQCTRPLGHDGDHHLARPPAPGMAGSDIARLILGVLAAIAFGAAGVNMTSLQSQSGNTVAELFDHYVGYFSYGMALLSLAITLPRPTR